MFASSAYLLTLAVWIGGLYLLLKCDLRRDRKGTKRKYEYWLQDGEALLVLGIVAFFCSECVLAVVGSEWRMDLIYGKNFPYGGIWLAEMLILMFGMIWPWPQDNKKPDLGRDALCLMTVLLLSLLLHIQVAWLYFGHGMAVPACYRGFARRMMDLAILMLMVAVPLGCFAFAGLYQKSLVTRQLLAPRGLTAGAYFLSAVRRLLYCGAFGLLVYEIEICAWFSC